MSKRKIEIKTTNENKLKSLEDKLNTAFSTTEPEEYINNTSESNTSSNTIEIEIPEENNSMDNNYEHVDHPVHYNNYDVEAIDMMEAIWGPEETAIFCKLNAFKYRMRMGTKPDNNINQDLEKEKWYLNKYHELLKKINN